MSKIRPGKWRCIVIWLTVAVIGCAYFSKEASVQTAVGDQGGPKDAGKVAVPLFVHEKYSAKSGEKEWLDSTITDRFVTGLLQHGYDVMDRERVRQTMRENQMSARELYHEENIQKIGMLLHADTIVLGKLTLIEQQDGTILSRKLNIRGVRILDGAVLFSLSAVDATMYRVLSGEDLVDQSVAKMFSNSNVSKPEQGRGTPPASSALAGAKIQAGTTRSPAVVAATDHTDSTLMSESTSASGGESEKKSSLENELPSGNEASDESLFVTSNGEKDTSDDATKTDKLDQRPMP